jgi:hypothetical protein
MIHDLKSGESPLIYIDSLDSKYSSKIKVVDMSQLNAD